MLPDPNLKAGGDNIIADSLDEGGPLEGLTSEEPLDDLVPEKVGALGDTMGAALAKRATLAMEEQAAPVTEATIVHNIEDLIGKINMNLKENDVLPKRYVLAIGKLEGAITRICSG